MANTSIQPAAAAETLVGSTPAPLSLNLTVPVFGLRLTVAAPTRFAGTPVSLQPAAGGLTLAGVAPSFAIQANLQRNFNAGAGGIWSAENILNAQMLCVRPAVLYRIYVAAAGSGGSLVINDCASIGAAATANQVISIPNANLTIGTTIELNYPFNNGICISAVPTGSPQLSASFT